MSTRRTHPSVLIFANPISGAGRGRTIAGRLARAMTAAGWHVHLYLEPAAKVESASILEHLADAVVCIGGDGTLLAVAERLLREFPAGATPPLLVVPLGTANLMARHLGCMWTDTTLEADMMAAILAGVTRQVDVAQANARPFLLVAGVGFDGQVVHELTARRRGAISFASYAGPVLRSMSAYDFPALTVELDGQVILQDTPSLVFVGNVREYGVGFAVTPNAVSDDGLLDVCVLPCRNWKELVELGCICGAQLQACHERAIYRKVKQLHVRGDRPVPVQLDGEAAGYTPLHIEMTSRQLKFVVRG